LGIDVRCGYDQVGRSLHDCFNLTFELIASNVEAVADDFEILPLDKTIEVKLIKECNDGWRIVFGRKQQG